MMARAARGGRGWRRLRDPYVFNERGESYLVHAVAGESGLAISRLILAEG